MNCRDIACILNEQDIAALDAAEAGEVRRHLAECDDCAGDWAIHEQIIGRNIPPLPDFLLRWHPGGTAEQEPELSKRRPSGRGYLLTALILAGAAAAMVSLYSNFETEVDLEPAADADSVTDEHESPVEPETPVDSDSAAELDIKATTVSPASVASEPGSIAIAADELLDVVVVWPPIHEGDNVTINRYASALNEALVRYLRTIPEIEVVELTNAQVAAAMSAIGDVADFGRVGVNPGGKIRAAVRSLGSEYVIGVHGRESATSDIGVISVGYESWSSNGIEFSAGAIGFAFGDGNCCWGQDVEVDGETIGRQIHVKWFPDSGMARMEAVIADVSRTDAERLQAMEYLLSSMPQVSPEGVVQYGSLSSQATADVIKFAQSAADAATRREAAFMLGRSGSALIAQPLTDMLLYDDDAAVRAAAAEALQQFRSDPAVQAALTFVAGSDAAAETRVQARWALLEDEARTSYINETLLDSSLTSKERLAPLVIIRAPRLGFSASAGMRSEVPPIAGEALNMIAQMVGDSDDSAVREAALLELGLGGHPDFVRLLLEEEDVRLRQQVVGGLLNRRNQWDVLEQIEQMSELETNEQILWQINRALHPEETGLPPGFPRIPTVQ